MKRRWVFLSGAVCAAALALLPKIFPYLRPRHVYAAAARLHTEEKFTFRANAPMTDAAPLFGAEKERLWSADWDPQFVYPPSAEDTRGMVFNIEHAHFKATWVNTEYDLKNGRVQYAYVIPDALVTLITLRLTPEGNRTKVEVQYDRTSLSPEADAHVQHLAEQDREAGPKWDKQINTYLQDRQGHTQ